MEMIGKIRRMYLRDKLSLHEITKRTGLSRSTVRRWLRSPKEAVPPTYRRQGDAVHLFDGFAPDVFAPGGGGEHIAFTAKNTLPLAQLGGNFRAEGDAVVNGREVTFIFVRGMLQAGWSFLRSNSFHSALTTLPMRAAVNAPRRGNSGHTSCPKKSAN